jgi:hypothetical protein
VLRGYGLYHMPTITDLRNAQASTILDLLDESLAPGKSITLARDETTGRALVRSATDTCHNGHTVRDALAQMLQGKKR